VLSIVEHRDSQWGDQRQQVLAQSGERRALLIRQIADQYIQGGDQQQAAAAQQASEQASAGAAATVAASHADAQQQIITKYLQPECARVGGDLRAMQGHPYCAEVPYYGTDGQQYYDTLMSYRQLHADAARLFRLLGLHPGPDITAPAAASLAGIPPPSARSLLDQLTRANLTTEHQPGRLARRWP
jgi:hypothetical protein